MALHYQLPIYRIDRDDLPEGWGLLWAKPSTITRRHGVPTNCGWWKDMPFSANKRAETQMMYSALRRLAIRGHFDQIYEPLRTSVIANA